MTEEAVSFRFRLNQDVLIVPLKLTGRVFAQCRRGEGFHEYRVIYWAEGKREDQWLFEHELTEPRANGG
jgi:hypothetical protein